jgi:hypothetical protein
VRGGGQQRPLTRAWRGPDVGAKTAEKVAKSRALRNAQSSDQPPYPIELHSLANETGAIFNAASCRINREVIPIPWLILKVCHGLPFRGNETPHVGAPCFNAPSMFLTV